MMTTAQQTAQISAKTVAGLLEAVSEGKPADHPLQGPRVLLEYVSANPNGPITAVHGRGGIIGDTLAHLLKWSGAGVTREFYVNDATSSRQMRQFARAVLKRYRQMFGQADWQEADAPLPDAEGYPDEYITHTAQSLIKAAGDRFAGLSDDVALPLLQAATTSLLREEQERILGTVNIRFDNWFSENALHSQGLVQKTLNRLQAAGHTYAQGDALWLRSTRFGDEADRVLLRADGSPTYLAGDLAYHADKFDRGFQRLIDIWSTDHAGYIQRTRAGLAALGYDPMQLEILLLGPVRLLRDGTEVKGSRLDGLIEVVTLAELLSELNEDQIRWAFSSAPLAVPLDVNVDRLRRDDESNPLWLIRYAHAVCRWAEQQEGAAIGESVAANVLNFRQVIAESVRLLAPDRIAQQALLLARDWLAFAGSGNPPAPVLARAVGATLRQAFDLLGINIKDDNA